MPASPPEPAATASSDAAAAPAGTTESDDKIVIIGAGPAGLTAAYELSKRNRTATVYEGDSVVGGISRTAERDGWKFDIGGHRFFTKVKPVERLWHEILTPDEFLTRPRMSRIYYEGKYYDYPIKVMNALKNLGLVEAIRCVVSYLWAKVRPPKTKSTTLEGYIVSNYGRRLYEHFFKTYNFKVWGVEATELSADWGAQRIKGMSLWAAVWEPVRSKFVGRRGDKSKQVTSLIEEFEYPKYGPGMMWERCTEPVEAAGSEVVMQTKVVRVAHQGGRATSVTIEHDGTATDVAADEIISSMPFPRLLQVMDPPPPEEVLTAAKNLTFRDFLTVALVVPESSGFPDNWIYIHSPEVEVGRIQNFGVWSPYLVKDGKTCLGLEYFVFEGDELWTSTDEDLIERGKRELQILGLVEPSLVEAGYVVRMPKAYPFYDDNYKDNVQVLRDWLEVNAPNVHPVGRNGMHKYNNQDHSMLTAMLTVENIADGATHSIWDVNVDEEYHEEDSSPSKASGTGRDAPVIPRSAYGDDHPVNQPAS